MNRADDLIAILRAAASPEHRSGMSRFGIPTERALGIAVPALRKIARETGTDHPLAVALWDTGWHEARLLAPMIADPRQTTVGLVDRWTQQFDAWDVCDLCCQNLLRRTAFAYELVERYAPREEEYVRRTAFALTAALAIGDKRSPDERFLPLLGLIGKAGGRSAQFRQESRQLGSETDRQTKPTAARRGRRAEPDAGLVARPYGPLDRPRRLARADRSENDRPDRKIRQGRESASLSRNGGHPPHAKTISTHEKNVAGSPSGSKDDPTGSSVRLRAKNAWQPAGRGSRQSARQTTVRLRR